jgi:hypothetical protein
MKLFKIIFAIVALSVHGIEKGYSQQSYYSVANARYLDSVEQVIKNYLCNDSLVYPAAYKKNLLKKDLPVIDVLNSFFDNTFATAHAATVICKPLRILLR